MLPKNYPFAPPSLMLLTRNGRFEVNKKVGLAELVFLIRYSRVFVILVSRGPTFLLFFLLFMLYVSCRVCSLFLSFAFAFSPRCSSVLRFLFYLLYVFPAPLLFLVCVFFLRTGQMSDCGSFSLRVASFSTFFLTFTKTFHLKEQYSFIYYFVYVWLVFA